MKTRTGFVSNSSSSSFVVIDHSDNKEYALRVLRSRGTQHERGFDESVLCLPHDLEGMSNCLEFGWERCRRDDFLDRLAFACLQACYHDDEEAGTDNCYSGSARRPTVGSWHEMISNALKSLDDTIKQVEFFVSRDWCQDSDEGVVTGFIDHQSSWVEGSNGEIFDSVEELRDFLFNEGSYVQTCNDNE